MKELVSVLISILFVLPILGYFAIVKTNDAIADGVKKDLLSLPLPQNTEVIDSFSSAGKLTGNGNGMQYFGALLLKSGLTEEELKSYYKNVQAANPYLQLTKQTSSKISAIEIGSYSFGKWSEGENEYILLNWGGRRFAAAADLLDFDLRGH